MPTFGWKRVCVKQLRCLLCERWVARGRLTLRIRPGGSTLSGSTLMRRSALRSPSIVFRRERRSQFGSARTSPFCVAALPSVPGIRSSRLNFCRFSKQNPAAGKRWHFSTALPLIRGARWRSILPSGVRDARRSCDHSLPGLRECFCESWWLELEKAFVTRRINKEGTVEGLRAAMQVDPANARVAAHLGRLLADEALKQGSDPHSLTQCLKLELNPRNVRLKSLGISLAKSLVDLQRFLKSLACFF